MTKPEGYEGHYADRATELEVLCDKLWEDGFTFGRASKQKETEQYKIIGYTQPGSLPIDPRGADSIYIVEEEGFDGCTVPVFVRAKDE